MTAPSVAHAATGATTSAGPWRNRIIGHGEEPPDQLLANPKNWRIHPKAQQDALAGVLDRVVNRATGHIVDGHLRVELALERQEPAVPVTYVDLSEEEEAVILASLDPLAAMAATDTAKLTELLAGVTLDNAALERHLVEFMGARAGGTKDPDEVPEPPAEPYVMPGDLWLLGEHRILCGDATKAEDVERLLAGATPALMVTDPPYGVNYDPAWRRRGRRLGEVSNDDRSDWSEAWRLSPATIAYVWHGGLHAGSAAAALEAVGYELRSQIIWVKPHIVFGRGAYHWRHEPCYYAVRHGANAAWDGDRKQETVWEIGHVNLHRDSTPEDPWTIHSTQKPVECMERPIRNHAGDVYEPFAGSGTTLIAAERTGRRCYAMELEPRYVQVAIERWQAYTGREAVRG